MDDNPAAPDRSGPETGTLPPVDVPQHEWAAHMLLCRARLNAMGDGLEWPDATFEQLSQLREIALVADERGLSARLAARFNFDRFVNATTREDGPAQPIGHVPDVQRFYTRVTDNGFHVVGVFSAATIAGRRHYFQWLTGAWVEIGLGGFLYVRDDLDTHFSEVTGAQLEETQPGAPTTSVSADVEWTIEKFESSFAPAAPLSAPAPSAQDVVEIPPAPSAQDVVEIPPAATSEPPRAAAPDAVVPTDGMNAEVQHGIAVAIATLAHRGSTDFGGAAYIDHPARVAERFDPEREPVRHCAAWLHDVLEASDLTEQDLLDAGVLPEIVDVVSILTRREGSAPGERLEHISRSADALAVKLAALDDNSAPWRLRRLDTAARSRLEEEHAETRAALGGAH